MTHEDVWRALDTLAAEKGLSPSGLARAAGLDPTAFNRSKRMTPHGRLRWPSTESLSRVLAATGASLENFTALVGGARALASLRPPGRGLERIGFAARRLPQIAFSALLRGGTAAESSEETAMPLEAEPGSYAIRLDTAAFEPVLREDGLLIASPETPVHAGDRVILHRHPDLVLAGIVGAVRPDEIGIDGFGCTGTVVLRTDSIRWMHRISWAAL
jgi:phage repressor protein C with HTH and peptisase S24 domain